MAKIIAFECSRCGEKFAPQAAPTICPKDGGPLYVRYDLGEIRRTTTRDAVNSGPSTMWRYAAVLPDAAC
jgi:threonine synthase